MQQVNSWPQKGPSREVRVERWKNRAFYASPCRFFLDVPLDMSGIIHAAVRDCVAHGYHQQPSGMTLITDAIFRGAALIEIVDPRPGDPHVQRMDGEMLARSLPDKGVRLRAELDELVRWSVDIGYEIGGCYVSYEPRDSSRSVRPAHLYAPIRGEEMLIESTRG